MADQVLLYVSAAPDLEGEREAVGRAVTEIPVTLGWRVVHSPARDEPADLDAVARADVHLLLLGSDVRAPAGLEWQAARRAGRWPVPFLKEGALRTPAAHDFIRFIARQAPWRRFHTAADLGSQVLRLLVDHLLERAGLFALAPAELAGLRAWRAALEKRLPDETGPTRGGAGESGVVLSPERYTPSEGVLIRSARRPGKASDSE